MQHVCRSDSTLVTSSSLRGQCPLYFFNSFLFLCWTAIHWTHTCTKPQQWIALSLCPLWLCLHQSMALLMFKQETSLTSQTLVINWERNWLMLVSNFIIKQMSLSALGWWWIRRLAQWQAALSSMSLEHVQQLNYDWEPPLYGLSPDNSWVSFCVSLLLQFQFYSWCVCDTIGWFSESCASVHCCKGAGWIDHSHLLQPKLHIHCQPINLKSFPQSSERRVITLLALMIIKSACMVIPEEGPPWQ